VIIVEVVRVSLDEFVVCVCVWLCVTGPELKCAFNAE